MFYDNSAGKKKVTWYNGPGIYVLDEVVSMTAINLEEMNAPSAQLKKNGSTYDVVYPLTDHLGNVRVTFKESGVGNGISVLSFSDYYAWGGVLPGRNVVSSTFRYGYQSKEKAPDGGLWDQFELRLYNHDIARWMAPDAYGQFHSPYISMANNPVNAVDPDGGYTFVDNTPNQAKSRNYLRMQEDKSLGRGAWAQDFLTKKYRDSYADIVSRYNVGWAGGTYGNVSGFMDALKLLNNQYLGLGLSNSVLENGTQTLNSNEAVNHANSIMGLNAGIGPLNTGARIGPSAYEYNHDASSLSMSWRKSSYTEVGTWMKQVGEKGGGDDEVLGYYGKTEDGTTFNLSQSEAEAFGFETNGIYDYLNPTESGGGVSSLSGGGGNVCPDCLDPSTIGKNLLGLTYPGGSNPLTRKGDYSYSYVPKNAAEYPAIGHDRRYDRLGVKGGSGLFGDTRAIGADWRFVGEELMIAGNPYLNPIERSSAGILGIGLGLSALPKTTFQLMQSIGGGSPTSFVQMMMWYNFSNQGVNNYPTVHKH